MDAELVWKFCPRRFSARETSERKALQATVVITENDVLLFSLQTASTETNQILLDKLSNLLHVTKNYQSGSNE